MSCWKILFVLTAGCLVFLLLDVPWPTHALFGSLQTEPAAGKADAHFQPQPMALPPKFAQIAPDALLQQAVDKFSPDKMPWLEMKIWQRSSFEECPFEMEGRYLGGPGQRMRLELYLKTGPLPAKYVLVSNGQTLVQTLTLAPEQSQVARISLIDGETPEMKPEEKVRRRELLLEEHASRGVAPLLRYVNQNLHEPQLAAVRYNGKELVQIQGDWPIGQKLNEGVLPDVRFRSVVRRCRLFLDAETLWPVRIEWWGSPGPQQPLSLLFRMEYRQPVFNQPLAPERMEREFKLEAN